VIAVDTSALIAIAQTQGQGDACLSALGRTDEALISAGTLAEALLVAARRGIVAEMAGLLERYQFTVGPVTSASARRVAEAYSRCRRGVHAPGLNLATALLT
jgi:ribonuclease VapC